MKAVIMVVLVALFLVLLFFAARWSLGKEWEKGAWPSFSRGIVISLAAWLFIGLIMPCGLFDRDQRRLFLGKSVSG